MKSSFLRGQDSMATPKQQEYIKQLAIDLQFDRKQRNAHAAAVIESITKKSRRIEALDELSLSEASAVIDRFKQWKEERK